VGGVGGGRSGLLGGKKWLRRVEAFSVLSVTMTGLPSALVDLRSGMRDLAPSDEPEIDGFADEVVPVGDSGFVS
jgi:hypothetical protein